MKNSSNKPDRGIVSCAYEGGLPHGLDRVLLLTVLLLLFYADTTWVLEIPFKVACGAAIFYPQLRHSASWWMIVTAYMCFVNAGDWYVIDNHKYLITLWSFCVTIGLLTELPEAVMRANAKWMIGFCFAFAVGWKIIAGEYWDGTFVLSTLLFDGRIEDFIVSAGAMSPDQMSLNRSLVRYASLDPWPGLAIPVEYPDSLTQVAIFLGWITLLVESLIACAWLSPVRYFKRVRHLVLMPFIFITYFFLPVVGFASILAVLGYASSLLFGESKAAKTYLVILAVIQLVSVPWSYLLLRTVTNV